MTNPTRQIALMLTVLRKKSRLEIRGFRVLCCVSIITPEVSELDAVNIMSKVPQYLERPEVGFS